MKWGFEECVSLEGKFYSRKELQCEQRLRGGNECILPGGLLPLHISLSVNKHL